MLSPQQRRFLEWVRDTPHHRAAWNEDDTKLEIAGDRNRITVDEKVVIACRAFIKGSAYKETRRMFELTPEGVQALAENPN